MPTKSGTIWTNCSPNRIRTLCSGMNRSYCTSKMRSSRRCQLSIHICYGKGLGVEPVAPFEHGSVILELRARADWPPSESAEKMRSASLSLSVFRVRIVAEILRFTLRKFRAKRRRTLRTHPQASRFSALQISYASCIPHPHAQIR
jgi:hypothetical protein